MKELSLASHWWPEIYPHQKPTTSSLKLIRVKSKWVCDNCERVSRLVRATSSGLCECAGCGSRFVSPIHFLKNKSINSKLNCDSNSMSRVRLSQSSRGLSSVVEQPSTNR